MLGQGYDAGWIAYAINRNDQLSIINNQANSNNKLSIIKRIAPWWFGERLEHYKFNGWANAWKVNPPSPEASEERSGWVVEGLRMTDDGLQIVIVYWPQYLQWVGFLLLIGTFGGLGLSFVRFKTRKIFNQGN